MGEAATKLGGFVSLLVVLLMGAVAWEVGEAGEDLMMMEQLQAAGSEYGEHSIGVGCFSDEEEFAMDSETNRMLQSGESTYLSSLMLRRNALSCSFRFRSYTSCGSPAKSPFKYNRCTGTCLRPNIII